jgi:hypothetical protein
MGDMNSGCECGLFSRALDWKDNTGGRWSTRLHNHVRKRETCAGLFRDEKDQHAPQWGPLARTSAAYLDLSKRDIPLPHLAGRHCGLGSSLILQSSLVVLRAFRVRVIENLAISTLHSVIQARLVDQRDQCLLHWPIP